ncbi:hypothetical protein ANANG_G00297570, partial [Anguilla anguilla]
ACVCVCVCVCACESACVCVCVCVCACECVCVCVCTHVCVHMCLALTEYTWEAGVNPRKSPHEEEEDEEDGSGLESVSPSPWLLFSPPPTGGDVTPSAPFFSSATWASAWKCLVEVGTLAGSEDFMLHLHSQGSCVRAEEKKAELRSAQPVTG